MYPCQQQSLLWLGFGYNPAVTMLWMPNGVHLAPNQPIGIAASWPLMGGSGWVPVPVNGNI